VSKIACPFCREPLSPPEGQENHCPRCGAMILLLRQCDLNTILEVIYSTLSPEAEIVVIPSASGGPHLVAAWDPNELLSTSKVAKIIGVSVDRVDHLIKEGKLPGAFRPPSPRAKGGLGRWKIPRRAVREFLLGRGK
jgi:hypothetical protein